MENLSDAHNNIIHDAINSNNNGNGSGCSYSHNTKDSNNTHNHLHFHFNETPTTPSPNASNDNLDAQISDAQMADVKDGLFEALLKSEPSELAALSFYCEGAKPAMQYQTDYQYMNDNVDEQISDAQINNIDARIREALLMAGLAPSACNYKAAKQEMHEAAKREMQYQNSHNSVHGADVHAILCGTYIPEGKRDKKIENDEKLPRWFYDDDSHDTKAEEPAEDDVSSGNELFSYLGNDGYENDSAKNSNTKNQGFNGKHNFNQNNKRYQNNNYEDALVDNLFGTTIFQWPEK